VQPFAVRAAIDADGPATRRQVHLRRPLGLLAGEEGALAVTLASGVAHHEASPKSRTPWARRFAAISQYASDISMPMALRPSALAANIVVPLPANGSSTMSPAIVVAAMHFVGSWVGNGHGCPSMPIS